MYDNIGGKIKGLAKWTFIVEAIGLIIAAMFIMVDDEDMIPVGLLAMIVGPLVAWISSWVLYGFGEIIDKLCEIANNTRGGATKSQAQEKEDFERISRIENLRTQGLISEEEYQQLVSKIK